MEDNTTTHVDELVTLSKYDGDVQEPEFEVERISIHNGTIIAHDVIENGEVSHPVEDSAILGTHIGRVVPQERG